MQLRPAGAPTCPRNARFVDHGTAPTDDQPSPGQEGEAVASSCLRLIWYGAGIGGMAREQFNRGESAATHSANYQLTWCKVQDELIKTLQELQIFSTCNITYNRGVKGEWHSTLIVWVPLRSTC